MSLNCKGFSLVEVLASFSLIFVTITFMFPAVIEIHQERAFIDYRREALKLLHNEKEAFLYDDFYLAGPRYLQVGNRQYELRVDSVDGLIEMCVLWEVPWTDYGQSCIYTQKASNFK